jgi:hypothetical protein
MRCCAIRALPALQPKYKARERWSGAQRHQPLSCVSGRTMRNGSHDMWLSDHDATCGASSGAEQEVELPKYVAATSQSPSEGALPSVSARETPAVNIASPAGGGLAGQAVAHGPNARFWRSTNPSARVATARRRVARAHYAHAARVCVCVCVRVCVRACVRASACVQQHNVAQAAVRACLDFVEL